MRRGAGLGLNQDLQDARMSRMDCRVGGHDGGAAGMATFAKGIICESKRPLFAAA